MEFTDIKTGAYLVMKDKHACKIAEVNKSKTGKHGTVKKTVIGIDVITGKKFQGLYNDKSILSAPSIKRAKYIVSNIEEEEEDCWFSIMEELSGEMLEGVSFPTEDEKCAQALELFNNGDNLTVTVMTVTIGNNVQYKITDVSKDN